MGSIPATITLTLDEYVHLTKEIERLTVLNRELENQYVLSNAILEAITDVLDGDTVSDFMESFPVVREVFDLRNRLILEREDSVNKELLEALQGLYAHTKNDHQICGLNESARTVIAKATGVYAEAILKET